MWLFPRRRLRARLSRNRASTVHDSGVEESNLQFALTLCERAQRASSSSSSVRAIIRVRQARRWRRGEGGGEGTFFRASEEKVTATRESVAATVGSARSPSPRSGFFRCVGEEGREEVRENVFVIVIVE